MVGSVGTIYASICDHDEVNHFEGVTVGGYRSFSSASPARLRHLGKINLIAGQNNAGKSNVLKAIQRIADKDSRGEANQPDRPIGEGETRLTTGYAVNLHTLSETLSSFGPGLAEDLQKIFNGTCAIESGQIWFEFDGWLAQQNPRNLSNAYLERVFTETSPESEQRAMGILPRFHKSSVVSGQASITLLQALQRNLRVPLPSVHTVAGFREITHTDDPDFADLNGSNLRRRLQRLQNPNLSDREDRARFDAIARFVRTVLEDASVSIDIPHDLSTILITQGGITLPIESLGTGVHEVVILAAAATVVENSVVCIEEPEIHLHPLLQRKLTRYLAQETSNQYFIATHSAHLLDSNLGSVHHVRKRSGFSEVSHVGAPEAQSRVCVDLGYRPSDLVQSNAVIWVEGPSDRLYIKEWIERRAPNEFIEGVHFSIMFYGGALLSSISPSDPDEVDEFVSLRRLNRYMVVVMDSDRKSELASVNQNKKRVRDALGEDQDTGYAWITAGYTIENYVPWSILRTAVTAVHPHSTTTADEPGTYENPLTNKRIGVEPNKTRIAREAVALWLEDWPLDLSERIDAVIALIRSANQTA